MTTNPRETNRVPQRESRDKGPKVNQAIRAAQIRVIDEEGAMLGVMTVPEALKIAEERALDLIEVAPNATPPTCKLMDFGKYKYELKKKQHEARKNQTTIVIKELQLRPRTEQHDLDVKLRHARRFLEDGFKTKLNLRFRGRELVHQELGQKLLQKVVDLLKDISIVETPAKMEGKQMFLLLAPDPIKLRDIAKAKKAEAARALKAEAKSLKAASTPAAAPDADEVETGDEEDAT